jgi:AcrR family transcriptional regulator
VTDTVIRPPRQRRSREALERVLKAGSELLQEVGYEGFTVLECSRRAEVSIGSLYARMPSKDALILAIYEREMQRLAHENERMTTVAGKTPRAVIEALVRQTATIMLGNAAVLRVFMQRAPVDGEIWRRGSERSHDLADAFARALQTHKAALAHDDPELAIDIAYRIVYSALARRLTHGTRFESAREVSDTVFVRELSRAVADYLLAD